MDQLFGSKTRVKLLHLFMGNPNRSFYVREITRKIEEQINSVRRELANLLSLGVITSDSTDNKLYYEVNQNWEHYPALRELFTGKRAKNTSSEKDTKKDKDAPADAPNEVVATVTKPNVDAKVWDKVGNIAGIFYSGVLTRDTSAPVDVMIVGDVPISRAEAAVAELEKQESKELRYAVMELTEWNYRRTVNDKFWLQVMSAKKQIVVDGQGIFKDDLYHG